jgi:hypothetical protein
VCKDGYAVTREVAMAAFADNANLHFSLGKKLNNEPRHADRREHKAGSDKDQF